MNLKVILILAVARMGLFRLSEAARATTSGTAHSTPNPWTDPHFDLKKYENSTDALRFILSVTDTTDDRNEPIHLGNPPLVLSRSSGAKLMATLDDGSRLKLSKTAGDRATEYRLTWRPNLAELTAKESSYDVCAQMMDLPDSSASRKTFWYSTSYGTKQDYLLEPFSGGDEKFWDTLSTKTNNFYTVEHLYLNSRGFVLILNELHPWQINYLPGREGPDLRLCFRIAIEQGWSDIGILHPGEYFSLDMRIVVAVDTPTAYLAAVNDFGHLARPARMPSKLTENFLKTVYSFDTLQMATGRKPPTKASEVESIIKNFLINFKANAPGEVPEILLETQGPINKWSKTNKKATADKKSAETLRIGALFGYSSVYCGVEQNQLQDRKTYPHRLSVSLGPWTDYLDYDKIADKTSGAQKEDFLLKSNRKDCREDLPDNAFSIDFSFSRAVRWYLNHLEQFRNESTIDVFYFENGALQSFDCYEEAIMKEGVHSELVRKFPDFMSTLYSMAGVAFSRDNIGPVETPYKIQALAPTVRITNINLEQVISILLTLSLAGYPFVMPVPSLALIDELNNSDIIIKQATTGLMRKWLHMTCLLPAFLQMPFDPFDKNVDKALKQVVAECQSLRASNSANNDYFAYLNETVKNWIQTGEPVIRPVWWMDPQSDRAFETTDQFMIGDRYLVAPFLDRDEQQNYRNYRNVYLPKGVWRLPENTTPFEGPGRFKIEENEQSLLYFLKDPEVKRN